jgi:hypothetical protein
MAAQKYCAGILSSQGMFLAYPYFTIISRADVLKKIFQRLLIVPEYGQPAFV